MYDVLQIWLGEGLVNSNGWKWHQRRKMITPSFHFKILQDFHVVMNSNAGKFVEKLKAIAEGGRIFDFQKKVHNLTLDIMCGEWGGRWGSQKQGRSLGDFFIILFEFIFRDGHGCAHQCHG